MSYGFWPCIYYQVFKKSHASQSIQTPLQLHCTIGQIIRQVKMHKQLLCLGIFVTFSVTSGLLFTLQKKFFCPWFMLHLTLTGASAYCCHGGTNFSLNTMSKHGNAGLVILLQTILFDGYPFNWQLDKLLP